MTAALDRHLPLILLIASAAILAAAYAFEHVGNLPPCELCWWQRYVYMAAIPLAVLALAFDRSHERGWSALLLLLLGLVFLGGLGIAGYHVGVEQKWWQGPGACTATALDGTLDDIFRSLLNAPVVRCDEAAWRLFGISMAGYNAALSAALAVLAFRGAWTRSRRAMP